MSSCILTVAREELGENKEMNVQLRKHGGGMKRFKRLLGGTRSAINACTNALMSKLVDVC